MHLKGDAAARDTLFDGLDLGERVCHGRQANSISCKIITQIFII